MEIRRTENFDSETLDAEEIDFQGAKMRRVEVTVKEILGPEDLGENRQPGAVDTLLVIRTEHREVTSNFIEMINFSHLFLYRGGLYLISNTILSRVCFGGGIFFLRECFLQDRRKPCKVRVGYDALALIDHSTSPETLVVLTNGDYHLTKPNTLFRCGSPEEFSNCFEVLFERKLSLKRGFEYVFLEMCSKCRIWLLDTSDTLEILSPDFSVLYRGNLTHPAPFHLEKRSWEIYLVLEDGSGESLSGLERYFD